MPVQNQRDKVIASYSISGYIEDDLSAEFITSSSSTIPGFTWYWPGIAFSGRSTSNVCPPGNIEKCHITIREPTKGIENPNNYTHVAHVAWGDWVANFLCSYDARAGILHNATLVDMNEIMQKATGWHWEDDEERLTKKDESEERQAAIDSGVDKKPRSKTIALGTLKDTDSLGDPYLGLKTHGAGVWITNPPEEPKQVTDKTLVLMASKQYDVGDEGRDENEIGQDEDGYKSFAEYLESLKGRMATKT